ncbi:MAG: sigma-70 family RNA polymerase sigma factor [Christensenellaceae bacterium]|nr:sigma-70 family RNA polymerase sigma factor [Christensenellaceae bacterium]
MPEEEALLIKRAQSSDAAALEALLKLYEKRVYNIAYRYMNNEADAYDMAQEALIKVYRGIRSFKGQSAFSSWVYRLTVNTCLDGLRKRRKVPLSLDHVLENGASFEAGAGDSPEQCALSLESAEDIQRAINSLSDDHRQVVILRDIIGLTYEEIAYSLDISVGTVKSRLNRGRQRLREMLIRN